jgi:hypothetical protein
LNQKRSAARKEGLGGAAIRSSRGIPGPEDDAEESTKELREPETIMTL